MGNRLRLVLAALACIAAGKTSAYENFKVAIYCRAQEVQKMADPKWLDKSWRAVSNEVHVDRIYIETYRDRILIDDATLEAVKKYFAERGVKVAGGITFTISEPRGSVSATSAIRSLPDAWSPEVITAFPPDVATTSAMRSLSVATITSETVAACVV